MLLHLFSIDLGIVLVVHFREVSSPLFYRTPFLIRQGSSVFLLFFFSILINNIFRFLWITCNYCSILISCLSKPFFVIYVIITYQKPLTEKIKIKTIALMQIKRWKLFHRKHEMQQQYNYAKSFRNTRYSYETTFSSFLLKLKNKNRTLKTLKTPKLTWALMKFVTRHSNILKLLCLQEKLCVPTNQDQEGPLKRRLQLISECHNEIKILSAKYKANYYAVIS